MSGAFERYFRLGASALGSLNMTGEKMALERKGLRYMKNAEMHSLS